MSDLRAAAQQALEALDAYLNATDSDQDAKARELMAQAFFDIRTALAQQKPNRAQRMIDAGYTRRPTLREMAALAQQEPADYERGFVDGMAHQAKSSVDKAVNKMAQQEQAEPVAHVENGVLVRSSLAPGYTGALYTAPPQRKPLTDEKIDAIEWHGSPRQFARAIERAHGIGGSDE